MPVSNPRVSDRLKHHDDYQPLLWVFPLADQSCMGIPPFWHQIPAGLGIIGFVLELYANEYVPADVLTVTPVCATVPRIA